MNAIAVAGRATVAARIDMAAVLLAGAAATVAFDLFGQALSPLAGFARLAPVGLADGAIAAVFGGKVAGGGHLLHYLTGLLAYPLGWLLVVRPIARAMAPAAPEAAVAALYGVGLWFFAIGIVAPMVVGLPFLLGFSGITWTALAGHVVFAVAFKQVYGRIAAD